MAANDDKEGTKTIIKAPETDPLDMTGEEATAAPMQSPFMDKTAMHRDPMIGTSVAATW